jgi:preprotein translocase subunit SecY
MIGVVNVVTSILVTIITTLSVYYRVSNVRYRIPLRSDQRVDFKTQPLNKYPHGPHIG